MDNVGSVGQSITRPGHYLRAGLSSLISVESENCSMSLYASNEDLHVQPWPATAAIMVANVIGCGVLALGGNFAQLGWIGGITVLVAGWIINSFTSILLNYVYCAYPSAVTCGDVAYKFIGPKTGCCFYGFLYTYLFLCMCNFIIVISDSIRSVFYWLQICRVPATLIGAALLIPGNQFRKLSSLTFLCVISSGTIAATLVICLATLMFSNSADSACIGDVSPPSLLTYSASICGFIFAFCGQSIMLEMQVEMKQPADFPKAVFSSFLALLTIYSLVGVTCYLTCGPKTPGELLDVLPKNRITSVAGILMVVHLLVSYTICQQVLVRASCIFLVPSAVLAGVKARVKWFCVSTTLLCLAWVVANLIPHFSDIVNITGGLLSTQLAFTVPAVLYVTLWQQRFLKRSTGMRSIAIVCFAILCMSAFCTISGTISNFILLIEHFGDGADSPFGCKL